MAKTFDPSDGMGVNTATATPGQPVSTMGNPHAGMAAPVAGSPAPPSTPYVPIDNASMMDPNPVASGPRGGRRAKRGGYANKGIGGLMTAAFPTDLAGTQATWMEIDTYKRTGVAIGTNNSEADYTATPSAGLNKIALPIPAGTGTSYGHSWDQSDISMVAEAALEFGLPEAQRSMNNVPPSRRGDTMGNVTDVMAKAKEGSLGALDGIIKGISAEAMAAGGIKSAGDVVASVGGGAGGLQAATGVSAFNEVVVHYAGPQFRTFEFSFSLKPKNAADQNTIRRIVRFLKAGSYPALRDSGGIGRVYEIPLFFKIKFMANGNEMQHMHKIGMCALTGLSVKFGGDRFQTFASTNDPVQTDISMSFKEVSLLHKDAVMDGY